MRPILPAFGLVLMLSALAAAETVTFKEHNFAIELPEGWTQGTAATPAVLVAKNADEKKIVVAIAAHISDNERASAISNMAAGAKASSKEKGWTISSENRLAMKGLTFVTFQAQMPDGTTVLNWMTSASNEVYSLQGISKGGDAGSDAELQSILGSFQLISAAPANPPDSDKDSLAYKAGRIFGCCLIPGIFIAIVAGLIVWLIRRNKSKA